MKKSIISFILFMFLSKVAVCQETYKFERIFPTLKQPWYFTTPLGIATDSKGFVYIADSNNHYIQKFTSEGYFVTRWGGFGDARNNPDDEILNGKFYQPTKIAIDKDDNIYITDTNNHRIQKFTSDGNFITKWGRPSAGYGQIEDGQFNRPEGIAVDSKGFIYVTDRNNHRIQKFTLDGEFKAKWGTYGSGDGEFDIPIDITIDSKGFIYVLDKDNNDGTDTVMKNHRVQKFDSEGKFIIKWGIFGTKDGEFNYPYGIGIDNQDFIYVTDTGNNRIQKFNPDGIFVSSLGKLSINEEYQKLVDKYSILINALDISYGTKKFLEYLSKDVKDGEFQGPSDITFDKEGFFYVADTNNNRIQKFTSDSQFKAKWGGIGNGKGEFQFPFGIATDNVRGFIYVADTLNHHIQKFDLTGKFLKEWGTKGSENGQLKSPLGISLDSDGNVFVIDSLNHRIQKFDSEGNFLSTFGSEGSKSGQFIFPMGIAIDSWNSIYVSDLLNFRIQIFNPDGTFQKTWGGFLSSNMILSPAIAVDEKGYVYITDFLSNSVKKLDTNHVIKEWGEEGEENGQFKLPLGLSVSNGYVYVTDFGNSRIQKFSQEGDFISVISEWGLDVGHLNYPTGLCVTDDKIYVTDSGNHRIQVFKKKSFTDKKKAIIVAGRKPDTDNLWDYIQTNANFAYQSMSYQGFTKETIYYLSSAPGLDIVDNDTTKANLKYAITEWAKDADALVIYLVDHGENNIFQMNKETLYSSELSEYLNSFSGKVTFIYDACKSGSFLPCLKSADSILITSASSDESAHFDSKGTLSFSYSFWTHILNGVNVKNAFSLTKEVIDLAFSNSLYSQNPLLDDNGDGIYNSNDGSLAEKTYIGNGTVYYGNPPEIGVISPEQTITNGSSATLYASSITDTDDEVVRVWAVINPPYEQEISDKTILEFPFIDLIYNKDNQRYEATYNSFNIKGTYLISIYARDKNQNTSIPKFTKVTVESPLRRKAILLAGGSQTDPLWNDIEKNTRLAYNSLSFQGYSDDDIYLMSSVSISEVPKMSVLPTLSNIEDAITRWAKDNTQDVVLYMIGNGDTEIFKISETETLSAVKLKELLDKSISGMFTVVYDASKSWSFLKLLPSQGKKRILISSTNETQTVNLDNSFSQYFWSDIAKGSNVKDSFYNAKNVINFLSEYQTPILDDNGNGIGNEDGSNGERDGAIAKEYIIGFGIKVAGIEPIIYSIADIDGNSKIEIADAIIVLKILVGIKTESCLCGNKDNKVGIEKVIYILQHLAGLRNL